MQFSFVLKLQKFNKYYYRLLNKKLFINSCMVVSYSGYPERSVSNQLSVRETSNENLKNDQAKFAAPLNTLLEKNCSKQFQQIIAHLIRFQIGLEKKTVLSLKKVALKSTFITIHLAMNLILLKHIRRYFVLLWNKNTILMGLLVKASHSFEK